MSLFEKMADDITAIIEARLARIEAALFDDALRGSSAPKRVGTTGWSDTLKKMVTITERDVSWPRTHESIFFMIAEVRTEAEDRAREEARKLVSRTMVDESNKSYRAGFAEGLEEASTVVDNLGPKLDSPVQALAAHLRYLAAQARK